MGISERAPLQSTDPKIWQASTQTGQTLRQVILAQVAKDGADIDISGLEFDFVRSIRVWDVRHYSHREQGQDDVCSESYNMRLGTYGHRANSAGNAQSQRQPQSGCFRHGAARHQAGDAELVMNGKITKPTTDMSGWLTK